MKKVIFFMFLFYSITLLAVGLPHSAYFQVYSLKDTTVVYPDTVSFEAWIIGRQVGNFKTP